jgi:hypothetical protein
MAEASVKSGDHVIQLTVDGDPVFRLLDLMP